MNAVLVFPLLRFSDGVTLIKRMIYGAKLHNIATWEKIFPTKQIEHVYYTTDMLVRKVTGYITVTRRTLMNGLVTNVTRRKRVRWDGCGRCYNINNNNRLRDYDIHFTD